MSYIIYKSDGTPITVDDNAIDIAYYNPTGGNVVAPATSGNGMGTQLIGRNTVDYGAAIAQNFLQLTENFSSASLYFPADNVALQGQLWFNKTSGTTGNLFVRKSGATSGGVSNWVQLVTLDSSGNVSGNSESTTNITGGAAGSVPYQVSTGVTAFVPTGLTGQVFSVGTNNTPAWISNPPLNGTNFTGIPNQGLTNSTVTIGNTPITLGGTKTTLTGLTSITSDIFNGALSGTASANVLKSGDSMSGLLILSGDPMTGLGAATKQYVDNVGTGINIHNACDTSTTSSSNLPANTYISGSVGGIPDNGAGVGATLTASATGTIGSIGGYSGLIVGARLLVKDQTNPIQNGVYVISNLGSLTTQWILTRASDYNNSVYGEVKAGDIVFITNGSLTGTQWAQSSLGSQSPGECTRVGTDIIVFTQYSSASQYSAGIGINISSNIISNTGVVNILSGSNIAVSSGTGAVTISVTGTVPSASSIAGGAAGYLPYQTSAGVTTLLAPTANGQVLTLTSGSPTWATPVAGPSSSASGNSFFTAGIGTGVENDIGAACSGYNSAYLFNNSTGWGLYSATGGVALEYSRSSGTITFNGNANTANTASNANALGGQGPGYYQPNLGFTPVQQGGGSYQLSNKLYIGWGSPGILRLQVDATDFGNTWPINITGTAGASNNSVGVNQSWYNVTASRGWNVIYTNTNSGPIQVLVCGEADQNNAWYLQIITPSGGIVGAIYGAITSNTAVRTGGSVSAIIPSGWSYRATGEQNTVSWLELR